MSGGNLIRKIKMECPLCDKIHEIEEMHLKLLIICMMKLRIKRQEIRK